MREHAPNRRRGETAQEKNRLHGVRTDDAPLTAHRGVKENSGYQKNVENLSRHAA